MVLKKMLMPVCNHPLFVSLLKCTFYLHGACAVRVTVVHGMGQSVCLSLCQSVH